MAQSSHLKRHANFGTIEDGLQKRSRLINGQLPSVDSTASAMRRPSFGSNSPGSPRSGLPSAQIAADFSESLQDLHNNDRYQISNLTLIAKESTEHAQAIARVLENHIRTAPPLRKLPALYVLDSIVKNVGTPYTLYFGQNLFTTFMNAYTLVDAQTRKAMEAMLKTWKEPVPGSMDSRPVFQVDIVRKIENALIKARTAFLQQQQEQARTQRQPHALPPRPVVNATPQTWASNTTPSQLDPRFAPPPMHSQPHTHQVQEQRYPPGPNESHISSLFPGLVQPARTSTPQATSNPFQIPLTSQPSYLSTPQQQPPYPPPSITPSNPPQYTAALSLADLLRAASGFAQPALTPQEQSQSFPQSVAPPPSSAFSPPPPQQFPSLFPALEALFRSTATPENRAPAFIPPPPFSQPPTTTPIPAFGGLMGSALPAQTAIASRPPLAEVKNDVQLSAASLKVPRPNLLANLYSSKPSQCLTCGRRFALDTISKARKARHLDSHFRANRSIADAVRKGVSRNWFVDEMDWIKSREVDDADEPPVIAGSAGLSTVDNGGAGFGISDGNDIGAFGSQTRGATTVAASTQEVYVKAPADAAVTRHACPICQEEFKTVWHDGAQEWVWMDALMVTGKAYHKSCIDELAKDRAK